MKVNESHEYTEEEEDGNRILLSLNHENIVKYYESFSETINGMNMNCIIMNYCEVNQSVTYCG